MMLGEGALGSPCLQTEGKRINSSPAIPVPKPLQDYKDMAAVMALGEGIWVCIYLYTTTGILFHDLNEATFSSSLSVIQTGTSSFWG